MTVAQEDERLAPDSARRDREMLQILASINSKLGVLLLVEIAIVVVLVVAVLAALLFGFGVFLPTD